ncbi:hypothetical protein ACI79C_12585 [Geodermatophilus sp. SYSU D00697]
MDTPRTSLSARPCFAGDIGPERREIECEPVTEPAAAPSEPAPAPVAPAPAAPAPA